VFDLLPPLVDEAKTIVAALDPSLMTGVQAAALVRDFAELERIASAGRVLLAHRVAETHAWEGQGDRNANEWMARQTGGSLGEARDAFETSRNLADQPTLGDALRNGEVSAEKAAAVSDAAKKRPEAEQELVDKAKHSPLGKVREECNKAKARGEDAAARAKRCHESRTAFVSSERDGMVTLSATGPVGPMAKLRAALEKRTEQIFRLRNKPGEREPRDRYAFDALIDLVTGEGSKSRARVNAQVRVDITALWRGWADPGELCDAPGVGELTVAEVEMLMVQKDALIDVVLMRGQDVVSAARADRYIPAQMRRALQLRDPCCVVPGCTSKGRVENDHIDGFARTRTTIITRLGPMCDPHHERKTRYGWVLERHPDGTYTFDPPPEERCRTD
jgi:hypothetical protein